MKKNLLLSLLLAGMCACGGWPPSTLPMLDEMLAHWGSAGSGNALRMVGEMALKLPDSQMAAEHTLVINASGHFKLEMFGPFEKRLFSMFCDGDNMLAIFYDENRAFYGAATPANLARFVGMDLNPPHIFQVLSAAAPFWLDAGRINQYGKIQASSNRGELLLVLATPDAPLQNIVFRQADYRLLSATLQEDDGRLFEITYRRWQEDNALPLSLEIAANDGRGLSISNDIVQWVDMPQFKLPTPPPGMELYLLDSPG